MRRLGEDVGQISLADMMAIEKALAFVLDLPWAGRMGIQQLLDSP